MYIIIIIQINCVLFYFIFLIGKLIKKHIESSYLRIQNCVIGISKIIYISKQDKNGPVLWVFYICTRLYMQVGCVNKLEINYLLY